MYTGLYAAVSGSMVQEKRLAVLTNNLANATTSGFKADKAVFHVEPLPVVVGVVHPEGAPQPFVRSLDRLQGQHSPQNHVMAVHTDFSQGPIRDTGNTLDLALEGRGFFVVQSPEGVAYTRQGTFSLNAEGTLVTASGLPVQGEQGPIQIRGSRVEVDSTGRVLVNGAMVDRLKLVDFPQPYALEKAGDVLFRPVVADPPETPAGAVVHQGAIEQANSDPIRLMVSVLETSRAYEAYQKVVQAFDDTAKRAVNDIASL
jgi:flagellar basal-body rod protein FlgG